jgi:acylphosphatase
VQPVLLTVNFLDGQLQNLENLCGKSGNSCNKIIAPWCKLWLYPPRVWTNAGQRLSMKRCRMCIFYSGHVQGVGFRYTTKAVAAGFEVTGSVRNLPDGRVELIAEGTRGELEAFRAAIRDAGLAGLVRDEKVTWSDAQNELHGFEIAG